MPNPRVSVIIPTYNGGHWLPETIGSVRIQSFQDYEIIVIDDGSSEPIQPHLPNDPRIIYIHQDNSGTSAARNRGLALARGEFIAFLDHDDKWKPDKLERQVNLLDRHHELGFVFCDYESFGQDAPRPNGFSRGMISRMPSIPLDPEGFVVEASDAYYLLLQDLFVQIPSTWMIRRILIERIGGFNPLLRRGGEDLHLALRLAEKCRFGFHGDAMTFRREFAGSLSARNDWQEELLLVMNLLLKNGEISTQASQHTFRARRECARNLARKDFREKNYRKACVKLAIALEKAIPFEKSTIKDIVFYLYSKICSFSKNY